MTNFSSSVKVARPAITVSYSKEDGIDLDEAQKLVDEGKYCFLTPTELGEYYVGQDKAFILRVQAPEPEHVPHDTTNFSIRNSHNYYKSQQRLRMTLKSTAEHMSRFAFEMDEDFPNVSIKRITKEIDWPTISEWIHTQTDGRWHMKILGNKDRVPGTSFMIVYFEDPNAQFYFKMFQL